MDRILTSVILSTVLCVPTGGFIFGFLNCSDCGFNIFGRLVVGIIYAVLTPVFKGFPPKDTSGSSNADNVWPYILAAWVLLIVAFLAIGWWRDREDRELLP